MMELDQKLVVESSFDWIIFESKKKTKIILVRFN